MKKLILILIIGLQGLIASAQRATLMPLVAGDTVANTGTVTKVLTFTAGYEGVAIQPVLTKLSGTAAGTVILYESLDGVNYKSTGDTLTVTNVTTNTAVWKKLAPVPVYYKVIAGGATTVSAVLRIYYLPRRHD